MHALSLVQFTSMTSKSSRKNNSSAVRTAPFIKALTFVLFILHAGCIKCTVVKLSMCTHIMWVTREDEIKLMIQRLPKPCHAEPEKMTIRHSFKHNYEIKLYYVINQIA